MANCEYCETYILFGGKREGPNRYCNTECQKKGQLKNAGDALPANVVKTYINQVHSSQCLQCRGPGPNDVHTSHRVWSAVVMTSWSSKPAVCCKKCGVKNKIGNIAFSSMLGWWGFPWGLIITPVIIIRNIIGFFERYDPHQPSKQLEKILRISMAAQALDVSPPRIAPRV